MSEAHTVYPHGAHAIPLGSQSRGQRGWAGTTRNAQQGRPGVRGLWKQDVAHISLF